MSTTPDDKEAASKEARAESVRRTLSGEDAPNEPEQPTGTSQGPDGKMAPEGVGDSITRSGEDVVKDEGKEPGRQDRGTDDTPAQRPTGTSTPRDATGIAPPESQDD
jgi:hypothetical protein